MTGHTVDRMVDKGVSGAEQMKLQAAEALEEAARRLRDADVSAHGEEVRHILHDVGARVNRFREEAGARYQELETEYHRRVEPVETIISNHPIPAVLVALGVGFLFGMLVSKVSD